MSEGSALCAIADRQLEANEINETNARSEALIGRYKRPNERGVSEALGSKTGVFFGRISSSPHLTAQCLIRRRGNAKGNP